MNKTIIEMIEHEAKVARVHHLARIIVFGCLIASMLLVGIVYIIG